MISAIAKNKIKNYDLMAIKRWQRPMVAFYTLLILFFIFHFFIFLFSMIFHHFYTLLIPIVAIAIIVVIVPNVLVFTNQTLLYDDWVVSSFWATKNMPNRILFIFSCFLWCFLWCYLTSEKKRLRQLWSIIDKF